MIWVKRFLKAAIALLAAELTVSLVVLAVGGAWYFNDPVLWAFIGTLLLVLVAPRWRTVLRYTCYFLIGCTAGLLMSWCWKANARATDRWAAEIAAQVAECRQMGGFPILKPGQSYLERCER